MSALGISLMASLILFAPPPDLPVTAAGVVTKCSYTGADGALQSWEKFNKVGGRDQLFASVIVSQPKTGGNTRVMVTYEVSPGPFVSGLQARYVLDVPGAFDPTATLTVPRDKINPGSAKYPATVQIN